MVDIKNSTVELTTDLNVSPKFLLGHFRVFCVPLLSPTYSSRVPNFSFPSLLGKLWKQHTQIARLKNLIPLLFPYKCLKN